MTSRLQFLLLDRQIIMTERALPGQVVGGLRALSTEIDRLDQAAADRYGLNRTDMRALDILGRSGPIAPTALARRPGFSHRRGDHRPGPPGEGRVHPQAAPIPATAAASWWRPPRPPPPGTRKSSAT